MPQSGTDRRPADGHAPGAPGEAQVQLRILETTDLHMHLFSYDYHTARATAAIGLARAAGLIDQLRAGAANTVLFDNGDFLQGSPLGDYVAMKKGLRVGELHPAIAAMNRIGYDAGTLGNHEFNYGLDFLLCALARAEFPVVSANVTVSQGAGPRADRTLVPPYVLLDRAVTDVAGQSHRLRLGVIGLVPPQTAIWDRHHLEGRVVLRDMVAAAAGWLPEIHEAGADVVVALAHTGLSRAATAAGMENAALPLAALQGIDVLLLGHTHLVFPSAQFHGCPGADPAAGTLHGKPAVMAGCYGSHVGVVDLLLERRNDRWRPVASRSEAVPIADRRVDGVMRPRVAGRGLILTEARALHRATQRDMARAVGRTDVPLASHFALIADTAALRLVGAAQVSHVARALAGTRHAGLPVLAASAPFKAGGRGGPDNYTSIPPGPLARRHIADLYAFTNAVRAVHISGADLADWLERAAAIYCRVVAQADDQPLIDAEFPSYNFETVLGVSYRIDTAQPARFDAAGQRVDAGASRIRDLRHLGRPVEPDATFILATNSYRLSILAGLEGGPAYEPVLEEDTPIRDVVAAWAQAQPGAIAVPEPGWAITLPQGARVTFDTSPKADPAQLSGLRAERVGPAPGGFARLRLRADP